MINIMNRERQIPPILHSRHRCVKVVHDDKPRGGNRRGNCAFYGFFGRLRMPSGKWLDHGSKSAIAVRSSVWMLGSRSNRYSRYRYGSKPFSLAVSTRLYAMALALAPRGVFANRKFFRPITNRLMERSLRLLSSSRCPPSKNVVSFDHWFRQYAKPPAPRRSWAVPVRSAPQAMPKTRPAPADLTSAALRGVLLASRPSGRIQS